MYCVYVMSSVDNKNVYVGSTKDFKRRCRHHMSLCNRNKHQSKVQAVYNLYGREGFEFDILSHHATQVEARDHEQAWVDYYQAHPTVWNLLNIATNNVDAPLCNPEVAAKMGRSQQKSIYVKWADGTELTFKSVTETAKHIGVSHTMIANWCKGKSTSHYKRGIDEVRYA